MCCAVLSCFSRVRFLGTPWIVALQAPLSMAILQARTLEWVVRPFSRRSSQHRGQTLASYIAGRFFIDWALREGRVQSLGWDDPLKDIMATHSSIFAWRIPWTNSLSLVSYSPWGHEESDDWRTNTHPCNVDTDAVEIDTDQQRWVWVIRFCAGGFLGPFKPQKKKKKTKPYLTKYFS